MKLKIFFISFMSILFIIKPGFSEPDPGAETIILQGGQSGSVPFPHKLHQDIVKDCGICHELFKQEIGTIEKLKSENKLKAKQVMNTQCLQCHRDNKNAGKASGPISCTTCHSK
jgi:cytochrome c-type protein NrfB